MNAPRRPPRLVVDGVILLDKPPGITSNAALQRVRRVFNAAKGGHTGTLDPLASGLLPVCLGEATKFSQTLLDADKSYEAELRLGVRTETGDAEGRTIEVRPVNCSVTLFSAACNGFVGEIDQTPPMHSALKVAGRPLYDYARQGVTLERASRRVSIRSVSVLDVAQDTARISVECSKGTYIRVLAEDIGAALGCGAHLTSLRRTGIGRFRIDQAVTLAQLEADPVGARQWLMPVDHLLSQWPEIELDEQTLQKFAHGQIIPLSASVGVGPVRVYGPNRRFVGAANFEGGKLHARRLLGNPDSAPHFGKNAEGS